MISLLDQGIQRSRRKQHINFFSPDLFTPAVGEVLHLAAHGPPTARQRSGSRLGALALARSSTSPNGSASSAPGSGGMDHTPSAKQATARCRADGQDAPPTAGPALCRGRAQRGWGALDAKPEQEAKELLALVVPAAPDLSGEHDEPLRAAAREFRAAVVGPDLRRRSVCEPLLWYDTTLRTNRFASDLDPRALDYEATPWQQACARAGEVVVALGSSAAVPTLSAAAPPRQGQG